MNYRSHQVHRAALLFVLACIVAVGARVARAADWPQYRGPNQDGVSDEAVKLPWGSDGPKVVWKVPTPNGFSSFAIVGGKAYTAVGRDEREVLVALDTATGKELWSADLDQAKYQKGGDRGAKDNNGGDGPRSTPTVDGGRVYVYTANMILYCFDAATGKPAWKHDVIKEFAGRKPAWSSAASPVIDGKLLFIAGGGPGQSLIALDKVSGNVVWKSHDEQTTHATPRLATICGQRQVIFFVQKGLVAVDPATGQTLWQFPFNFKVATAASPVVCGDIVFCAAGYGMGGGACRISKSGEGLTATELYKVPGDSQLAAHWSTPVCKDGYLYGMFSFAKYGVGPLKCVEAATGKVMWEQPGFGPGQVILAGDKLLALADDGRLVVVATKPDQYTELASFKAVTGKCWSTPALSDGRVYLRSTKEAACLDISGK